MELSAGVVSRAIPCNPSGARDGPRLARPLIGVFRNFGGLPMSSGFRDDGHVKYYSGGAICGGGKAEKLAEKAAKKKLKLVKSLYKKLSEYTQVSLGPGEVSSSVDEPGKRLSEATETILEELKWLKAEEKEIKRRRKEEKARLKAERMEKLMVSESSSSSSSESSDNEAGEVVRMSWLRTELPSHRSVELPGSIPQGVVVPTLLSSIPLDTSSIPTTTSVDVNWEPVNKNIEVCMGGKCRKSGGAVLLEELQRKVGIEGAVVGCKCMGKCRDGPNVRVCNRTQSCAEGEYDSSVRVTASSNPLCVGVGLDNVSLIVSNFFGTEQNDLLDVNLFPA